MSNFTFGLNVFKSRLLLLRQNASAGEKGLQSSAPLPKLTAAVNKGILLTQLCLRWPRFTDQHRLIESGRESAKKHYLKLFENRPNGFEVIFLKQFYFGCNETQKSEVLKEFM